MVNRTREFITGERLRSKRLYGRMLISYHFNRYISMVAASCMVLYGYDASVYNSVQGSKNWDNWFDHSVEACVPRNQSMFMRTVS